MKKHSKLLCMVLSFLLLLSLAPAVALATGSEISVDSATALQNAIDSAENDSSVIIKLSDNITLSSGLTIPEGKTITIELNGKTISGNTDSAGTYAVITNKGTLTIQDNTDTRKDGTGSGLITSYIQNPDTGDVPGYASNTITNHGTLTVKSGKIVNNGAGYACFAIDNQTNGNLYTPVLNIEGGRMVQNNAETYAVRMFCNSTTNVNTVNISGGVIEGGYGLWLQMATADANKAALTISGGTLNAGGGFAFFASHPLLNPDYSNASLKISGGTINGTGAAIKGPKTDCGFKELSVTGGTFVGFQTGDNLSGFISGGTFENNPNKPLNKLLADDFVLEENSDGTFSAVKIRIIEGEGQIWTKGSRTGLRFKSNADFGEFSSVSVDGEAEDNQLTETDHYTKREGSTIVTLLPAYLNTLTPGQHTLYIISERGTADTTFTITTKGVPGVILNTPSDNANADNTPADTTDAADNKADADARALDNVPKTADNGRLPLWAALILVSGLAGAALCGKRRRAN